MVLVFVWATCGFGATAGAVVFFAAPAVVAVVVVIAVTAGAGPGLDDDAAELGLAPKSSGRAVLRGETVALFEMRSFGSAVAVEVVAPVVVEEDEEAAGGVLPFPLSDADTDASCA